MGIQDHSVALENQSIHLAAVDAGPAALTPFRLMSSSERTDNEFGWPWMSLDTGQNPTTAATAATHDNHFPRIVGLEDQVSLVGYGKDVCYFRSINIACYSITNIIIRPFAEYEACLLGRIAANTYFLSLATADAGSYCELLMSVDQLLSPFVR